MRFASQTIPGLEKYAAQELEELGSRVDAILPGFVLHSCSDSAFKIRMPRGILGIYALKEIYTGEAPRHRCAALRPGGDITYGMLRGLVEKECKKPKRGDLVLWGAGNMIVETENIGMENLHHRQYMKFRHPASLNPVLAYLMLRFSGWMGESIADPFCGSGTILIEAALYRGKISGFGLDIREDYLTGARKNAEAAGVHIRFQLGDARELHKYGEAEHIITNPPYGLRIGDKNKIYRLYEQFAEELEEHFSGALLTIITPISKLEHYFDVVDSVEIMHGKLKNKIWKLKI
jgi:23S rRNA G2445 N2-methylase RlmL